uniref:non-specific serine/threonine protein kinase n=1 Tax=Solanum tuberosum TaxID=4113 RepID=M1BKT5_SOLTU
MKGTNRSQRQSFQQHLIIDYSAGPRKHHHKFGFSFKSVTKKLSDVFSTLVFWQKKANSETNRSQSPEREVSSSKGSNSSGSKRGILLKPQYSNSHRTSMATREQLGTFEFSFEEICQATGNFSAVHKIGEGGFGTVYKGKLKNGFPVAIKRAKKDLRVLAEFKNEVQALSKIEHLNLVRFYGFLELRDERIIITEYVSNGTLREHLDGKNGTELEVAERLSIAIDVAHAITYLHSYTDPPIIHRDIKASNILITENLHAKVADFGFARLAAEDPCATHISTQIKGTAGYLDPEYLRTYQLTEKSDVYSFGVLLVEMMTGRHPIETNRTIDERVTIKWAMRILKHGDSVIAMDPRLRRSPASIEAVEKVLKLARQCLAPSRLARPAMKKCAEPWTTWLRMTDTFMERRDIIYISSFSDDEVVRGEEKNDDNLETIKSKSQVQNNINLSPRYSQNTGRVYGSIEHETITDKDSQIDNIQSVNIKIHTQNDPPFLLTVVYAKCTEALRMELWDDIRSLANNCLDPWGVIGDFNVIMGSEEKLGGRDHIFEESLEYLDC